MSQQESQPSNSRSDPPTTISNEEGDFTSQVVTEIYFKFGEGIDTTYFVPATSIDLDDDDDIRTTRKPQVASLGAASGEDLIT
ncbi:hypothetical protein I350_04492 [Cryptococcus amylolentus CBS 6273]|uniref:Uncharacterized protein n=1 Tax=Cryptococcus amylolentus CBS 6273 TaxID=1296118 RepID=A0A1E3K4G0_9TREE|nr:hypothetical protein I350_04492 [Cryptococcus amylolentus CBS 6273]